MTHPLLEHWSEISWHPAPVWFQPESEAALQQLLRGDSGACLLAGNGSKWWLGNPLRPVRYCVDLRSFNRLLEYLPGDLTATVQAGMDLSTLNAVLSERGQTFPVDPPLAYHATVGGIIASGISGPLQQAYGSVRDKVLGMKVMLADGTMVRAGGKVVKNVAGYDLCKLYTASMGTLAIILEITLRVFPAWQREAYFSLPVSDYEEAKARCLELRGLPVRPAGVVCAQSGRPGPCLLVRLHGGRKAVDNQLAGLARRFPAGQVDSSDRIASALASLYDDPSPLRLRAESLLSSMVEAARKIERAIPVVSSLLDFSSRRCCFAAAAASPEALGAVREDLRHSHTALIIEKAPLALKRQIDVWGSARGDLPLARKIKSALDPHGRFNPGIYVADI
ncbi:MAG: FAD-binding oxidoreductase [Acidobacteria bacterium]|nr:FAD-binding oxidoreductase [Acidobacteriota bacterium]